MYKTCLLKGRPAEAEVSFRILFFFFELGVSGGLPEVGLSPHAALESVGADLRSPCTDLPHKSRR